MSSYKSAQAMITTESSGLAPLPTPTTSSQTSPTSTRTSPTWTGSTASANGTNEASDVLGSHLLRAAVVGMYLFVLPVF